MVNVMVLLFKFDLGVVFSNFLQLQGNEGKNSIVNHSPAVFRHQDQMVLAVVDRMGLLSVVHSFMVAGGFGNPLPPPADAGGIKLGRMKRRCVTVELEPVFCDVIIKRFEALTKTHAKKIN